MSQNKFFPIYKQLEREFIDLSYFITFDKRQLSVYSIKIADLILRTVSECENISNELCKKEHIKFYDKNHHIKQIIFFNEYILELDKVYNLSNKLVDFKFDNSNHNIFDCKLMPFKKDIRIKVNKKDKETWSWYNSYNKIKHDRIKFYKEANIGNLINSLSALFLLNIYYLDKTFYSITDYDLDLIIENIKSFSEVFEIDYAVNTSEMVSDTYAYNDTFFHPNTFWKVAREYSTYIISYDKEFKTDADRGSDLMDKLEAGVHIMQKDGSLKKKHDVYNYANHVTKCKVLAEINKKY